MKRFSALLLLALCLTDDALAEDSVSFVGNYYKERSTRVYEPIVRVAKDLPGIAEFDATFAVDQVTSASGAFTPSDRVLHEFREEVQIGVRRELGEHFKPGIRGRFSYEPDYTSRMIGADLRLGFRRDTTVLTTFLQYQNDDVRARMSSFNDKLETVVLGVGFSQVLLPNLVVGVGAETQIVRGFQENFYRVETHPRERNRYAASLFAAYHFDPTETTIRLAYRFYGDTWDLFSHTIDTELTQTVLSGLELIGRFRFYKQSEVYFASTREPYTTADPKLFAFNSPLFGLGLSYTLDFMSGSSFLPSLGRSRIEPMYSLYDQGNAYGIAHMAQLAWHWPF